jgi:hypothetical protein
MQLIHTNKKIVSLAIMMGAMLLLPLSFAAAETSSIYQEVMTSSNSGGQSSDRSATEQNTATVEVRSTTIINGEEYNYYFSTSTLNGVEHQVTIVDGVPVLSETGTPDNSASVELSVQEYGEYETWITSMINLLNYLQLYVANTF